MENHWTNLLYPITAGVIVQTVMAVLRYFASRIHRNLMLEEQQKHTAILRSIDRRIRSFEFGKEEEIIG